VCRGIVGPGLIFPHEYEPLSYELVPILIRTDGDDQAMTELIAHITHFEMPGFLLTFAVGLVSGAALFALAWRSRTR